MKCTSCVSAARPKSDDDEEASVSPAPTMDKPEQEYRVESPPPPPLPERASRIPSVSIVELPSDYRGVSPSPSGTSQLLRPLDVITEETSDVSDCENREPPPKPDLCFPRPKPRYKKPKSKNLLKNLLRQEPTTCVLVDAKIAETAPEEYRSVCTTEVVPEQILEVEVIDLGSNSSSLADLTDIDDLEPDKINNNDIEPSPIDSTEQPPPTSQPDDNDNDNESIAVEDAEQFSEEDNNGYDESTTQPPPQSTDACTQNDDDHHDDDGDQQCHEENERTESDRDDEEAAAERSTSSLAAGVDRVVTQRQNVNEVKERCTDDEDEDDQEEDDQDDDRSSDCSAEVTHPAIGESLVTVESSAMGEEEAPEVPPRPPPPPAMAAVPLVSAAERPTAAAVAVTNLGQDEHEGVRHRDDAQIPAGSDTGEADPADADQNSEEDSGDAVAVESVSSTSDSSVLLKLLQDPVEKRPTFGGLPDQISAAAATSENPQSSSLGATGTKIERAVKSEQLNYEIVQDHRVLREETVTTTSSASGSEVVLRRRGTGDRNEPSPKEPSPEQKAALVHDLRNEISRIKDAELQEEFRKLELEAARIEQELGNMAVVPPPAENLTYYVSKQNDFAVERPPPPAVLPRQKPPVVATAPTPPPKPASYNLSKSASSNDLMYNEWQAKMEEREARRLHKVVKISKTDPPNPPIPLPPPPTQPDQEDSDLGDEFHRKVKERRRKFTIPGADSDCDSAPGSTPGTPIAGRKPIPKHIEQEFAEFAKIRQQQQQQQEPEEEQKPVVNTSQHQSRPRTNPSNPPKAPPPQKISYPPPPVSVANSPPTQNGTNGVDSGAGESVKVSALVDVFQQKQREVLRQDSYKAAVRSVASSAENLAEPEPEPVSVSAKCQEFERKLQRSASSDGRKPLSAVKLNSAASNTVKPVAPSSNRNGSYSELDLASDDDFVTAAVPRNTSRNGARCEESGSGGATSNTCNSSGNVCNGNNTANRRSFSEADLLHEIDRALVLAKDFLFSRESPQKQPPASSSSSPFCIGPKFKARASPGSGVWSPHNRSTEILTKAELAERSRDQQQHRSTNPDPPPQPVWTPRSAPPSPVAERREFRPIGFESPTPQRRNQCATPTTPAPWTTSPGYEKPVEFSSKPNVSQATTRPEPTSGGTEQRGGGGRTLQNSNSLPTIGHSVRFAPQQQSRQQAVPSPTINSLLKNKDGKVGQQVSTFESTSNQSNVYQTSTSQRTTTNQQTSYQRSSSGTRLGGRTSEISQPAGRQVDYLSEPESVLDHQQQQQQRSTPTMAQLSPRKVDGIGPMTREGMPLTLRSEVDENNQAKWYKKMYQTLHKAHDDGNFPYKSSGGYQSEPEPNYDSDYTIKYSTLDRRRTPTALNPNSYSRFNTLQGSAIKSGSTQYRNQPGRIENYTPGRSSISEKESKEWWDEVMDIFNGQIEQQKLSNSKTYTEGNLSRALKQEQGGYDSDTTLIFRKKEPPASSALSPIEQKQYYKNMQAGGEIPVQGFRKPAPEKPKEFSNVPPPPPMKGTSLLPNSSSPYSKSSNEPESPRRYIESDVNIHYKTPIRYEYKEAIPDDELAYRQAEHMRRVYQEERRRKYMHELEDLQNRRHTDNFVPSQKSPIPVNRYEDFDADLAPKPNNVLPRTIARALYNFQGQTARELSFKKGDIIYLRRQIDKNWYEGEHNAMIGLLPANYIEILPRDGAKPLPKKPTREGKARAKFNFTAQTSVELSLMKGELVTLTRRVDDNWFEGRVGNKKGIFPVSYVEVLTDIGGEESYEIEPIVKPNLQTIQTHTLTTGYDNGLSNGRISPGIIRETKTVQKTEVLHVDTTNEPISYRALYNYKPQNSDELELLEGDVVYVLEKCDDGWYVGTSARTGCFGTFPGNYVKKL